MAIANSPSFLQTIENNAIKQQNYQTEICSLVWYGSWWMDCHLEEIAQWSRREVLISEDEMIDAKDRTIHKGYKSDWSTYHHHVEDKGRWGYWLLSPSKKDLEFQYVYWGRWSYISTVNDYWEIVVGLFKWTNLIKQVVNWVEASLFAVFNGHVRPVLDQEEIAYYT